MRETSHKIIRNTLTNTASFTVVFVSNLVLLPLIVHALGNEYYGGIWVIVGTLTAYMGLIDLGTGTAFIKFVSEYHAKGDDASLNEVINTGIVVYAAVGLVLVSAGFFADNLILGAVGVPVGIMDDARFVFRVGIIIFAFANIVSPLTSVTNGIQRMDINSYVTMATQLLNVVGTILVLTMGFGIRGLILNNLIIVVLNSACLIYFAFHWLPRLTLGMHYYRFSRVKQFIGYGLNLQVSRLAQFILFQTDRVLSLRFFGILSATYYDIGARLSSAGRSISFLSISALIPAVAELEARQQYENILAIYERGSKYIAVSATFVFAFLFGFAPNILVAWMGEQYSSSTGIVRVLAVGYFFNICTGVASSLAAGMGKTEFERRFGIFACIFNVAATVGGLLLFGPIGIAVGTSLTLALGGLYFMKLFHSYLQFPVRRILAVYVRPLAIGAVSVVVVGLPGYVFGIEVHDKWERFAVLAGQGLFYSGVFVSLLFLLKVVDENDMQTIRAFVHRSARARSLNQ